MSKREIFVGAGTEERGLAYIELGVWSALMVPVVLLAANIVGVVHDRIRMQQMPVAAVREFSAPALRLRMEGAGGLLEINSSGLSTVIRSIRDRIVADSERSLVGGITDISALACFWVFRVDQGTGALTSQEREVCESVGSLAAGMSLRSELDEFRQAALGYPLAAPGESSTYMEYAVLIGAAVAGKVRGISLSDEGTIVQFVHISLPREEVSL